MRTYPYLEFEKQVKEMRQAIAEMGLLVESLMLFERPKAIESACKVEAKLHQMTATIRQVIEAPQPQRGSTVDDAQADHVVAITNDGQLIIRKSRTLPPGRYHLSDFDHENLVEAIAAATEPLPFSEPLDLFETAPPSNGAAIVGGSDNW